MKKPPDVVFESFKRDLGDYVTQVINQRIRFASVGHTAPCYCPMGCHPQLRHIPMRTSLPWLLTLKLPAYWRSNYGDYIQDKSVIQIKQRINEHGTVWGLW